MNWSNRPFVRLLLFLLTGIFIGYYFPAVRAIPQLALLSTLFVGLMALAGVAIYLKSFRFRWISGAVMGLSIFVLGVLVTTVHLKNNTIDRNLLQNKAWIAEIISEPERKPKTIKALVKLTPVHNNIRIESKDLQAIVFFEKDTFAESLQVGNRFLFKGDLQHPEGVKNPEAFDYRQFLQRKGIQYLTFLKKDNWKQLKNAKIPWYYFPSRLRRKLVQTLHNNGLSGDEFSVASAILLGYNQLMDANMEKSYAAAGVVHVLCVSGLHVGIIYLVFNFLLSFLKKSKRQRFLKAMLLLLIIWFYALLTGLSPSVWRAAVMISLFIIGDNLQRDSDKYNTLAASAFIILLINPLLIFDVGFELSYAAVMGILLFYQPLNALLFFKSKIFKTLWSVVSLSLAAQAGAFPIAAHYFHTFPLYFILTNIAVFALAYLIVTTGIFFMLLSPVKPIALLLGKILSGMVYLMNVIVRFVASLPSAQITMLYFPWVKVALVYAVLLSLFFWLWQNKSRYLFSLFGILVLLVGFQTFLKWQRDTQSNMVFYDIPKGISIDLIDGNQHLLLVDSMALKFPKKRAYADANFFIKKGLDDSTPGLCSQKYRNRAFFYRNGFLSFHDTKFFIVQKTTKTFPKMIPKIAIDYLIISTPTPKSLREMQNSFDFKSIILPSFMSAYQRKKIIKEAKRLNINYHDVKETGAILF